MADPGFNFGGAGPMFSLKTYVLNNSYKLRMAIKLIKPNLGQ